LRLGDAESELFNIWGRRGRIREMPPYASDAERLEVREALPKSGDRMDEAREIVGTIFK